MEKEKYYINKAVKDQVIQELIKQHGKDYEGRIINGISQVANQWREEDGSREDFTNFSTKYLLTKKEDLNESFLRLENAFEGLYGHALSIYKKMVFSRDVDVGRPLEIDNLLSTYDPFAHISDDLFKTKIAFFVLLNFEFEPLQARLNHGHSWDRLKWGITNLVDNFVERYPATLSQEITRKIMQAVNYVNTYNIYLHHVLPTSGERFFPKDLRLISHWGLRDEIKTNYEYEDGLEKQKLIEKIMEAIVQQTIPKSVINNPGVDWFIENNRVISYKDKKQLEYEREQDERYKVFIDNFYAHKSLDDYSQYYPTQFHRNFERTLQMPEEQVVNIFNSLLSSKTLTKVSEILQARLNRKLEPFDIWYPGFQPNVGIQEHELDQITKKRYPNADVFNQDIPRIFQDFGFSSDLAYSLASSIEVHPSRGVGHAFGISRRGDKAYLRTRFGKDGMSYKEYNIAIHELGHNVEQVISHKLIDRPSLGGIPSSAFTEAVAMLFQKRDLEFLGIDRQDRTKENHFLILDRFWTACEISAVSLVEIEIWHWLYNQQDEAISPENLREAVIRISKETWNQFYSKIVGTTDSTLLGIYSQPLTHMLYMSNYALGILIQYQLEAKLAEKANIASEIERICKLGAITPNLWMKNAIGQEISAEPLILATEKTLDVVK